MGSSSNDFYVCLLSTNSQQIYSNNVLSAFTNLLKTPLNLDESWCVGLSEIAFNERKFLSKTKRSIETKPITDIVIKTSVKNCIFKITYAQLYNVENEYFIDFSLFLSHFSNFITCDSNNANTVRENQKRLIFDYLESEELKNIPFQKINRRKNEFAVSITLPSSETVNNIVLKNKTYESITNFIFSIISQIPINLRRVDDLKRVFNIFYPIKNYFATEQNDKVLFIPFDEYQTIIEVNSADILKELLVTKEIKIDELLLYLAKQVKFLKSDITVTEQYEIREIIHKNILGEIRTFTNKDEEIKKTYNKSNSFKLLLPYNQTLNKNYEMHSVIVEIKKYDRMQLFLKELFYQIPKDKRNITVLIDYLEAIFPKYKNIENIHKDINDENEEQNVKSIFIMPNWDKEEEKEENEENKRKKVKTFHYDNNTIKPLQEKYLIYCYSDIIKPRIIGDTQSRFLRIIPIQKENDKIEFKNIEYCQIEKNYIESISILITDMYGKLIEFNDSYFPTYMMLHFKKKMNK